jgi:hypothetical protein
MGQSRRRFARSPPPKAKIPNGQTDRQLSISQRRKQRPKAKMISDAMDL